MRAFIAHRQTFVIWGCIYLWDSNPFSTLSLATWNGSGSNGRACEIVLPLYFTDTPFLPPRSLASPIFQNYALSTSLFSTENRNTAILPISSKINPPTLEHLLEKNIATIFSKIISARWTFEITWERLRRRPWLFHNAGYSEAACCAAARISIGRFHF